MFCKFRMHFSTGVTTRWGLLHVQDFVATKVTINQLKMKCMQVPVVYVNNYNYLLQKLHKHASQTQQQNCLAMVTVLSLSELSFYRFTDHRFSITLTNDHDPPVLQRTVFFTLRDG